MTGWTPPLQVCTRKQVVFTLCVVDDTTGKAYNVKWVIAMQTEENYFRDLRFLNPFKQKWHLKHFTDSMSK